MKRGVKKHNVLEHLAVFQEEKTGGFSVWIPELPGCVSQGESFEDALANIKEAATLYLESTKPGPSKNQDYKKQFVVPVKLSYA
jgi:predicted RNase H-like HicB family nuclease